MADAVRSGVGDAGGLEHPAPAAIVLAKGQVLGRVVGRRQDVGAALTARRRRKQPIGFLAHGLGNAADLAVGPHHAPFLEVQPAPFERADFGSRSEEHTSELQSLMRISYAVFCLKKKKIKRMK